jgi:polar amino acid transport system substrate-binding protein
MKNDQRISLSGFIRNLAHSGIFAAAAALILLANATSISAQPKSLVLAVEDDAAPWSQHDGSGYANDLVTAAFEAVGVAVELRVMPYARCKRMAVNGEIAGCLSMSPSPDFAGLVQLSTKPLFTCHAGYFYSVNKPPRVARQEDLPRKTVVGTVIGYEYPAAFEKLSQQGFIIREESPSEDVNLRKLALGRVDLALLNYNQMKSPEWLITRAGVNGKVKTTFRAGTLKSYIGFSKGHQQGLWALGQFNKGYHLIAANGTLRRLRAKWNRKLHQKTSRTRFKTGLAAKTPSRQGC